MTPANGFSATSAGTNGSPSNENRRKSGTLPIAPRLGTILVIALALRIVAAFGVQHFADRKGAICLFGDTPIYWQYAQSIADGTPYVVYQWEVPHYALRTPGYPLWLAAHIWCFGERALPIRLGQAVFGAIAAWWTYRLACESGFSDNAARWSALAAAVDPLSIAFGALLLTESLFAPLVVGFVLVWVRCWRQLDEKDLSIGGHAAFVGIGAMQAFLSLVRPSWGVFLPVLFVMTAIHAERRRGIRKAVLVLSAMAFGWGLTTAPWAVRNLERIDRFAVGGTWGGASLYDSVRPGATGASEMSFVAAPEFRDLKETDQDDLWKSLSFQAMRDEPIRVVGLAWEKQKRFWSAWPNDSARIPWFVRAGCAAVMAPIWAVLSAGIWRNRNRAATWLVLAPLATAALTHLVFVGSIRYRVAVAMPVWIFFGEGLESLAQRLSSRGRANQSVSEPERVMSN